MSDIEVEHCYFAVTQSDEVECVIGPALDTQHSETLVNLRPRNTMQNTRHPAHRVLTAAETLSTQSARTMTLTDLAGVVSSQQHPATTVVFESSGRQVILPVTDSSAAQTVPFVGGNETVLRVQRQQQPAQPETDQPRALAGWTTIHQEMMTEYLTDDSIQQPQQQLSFVDQSQAGDESVATKLAARYSVIDQEHMYTVIREMKESSASVVFMPSNVRSQSDIVVTSQQLARLTYGGDLCDVEDAESKIVVPNAELMFVYQSVEMKRMYRRYGGLMVVLDAVYRAGRYPLPLFFLLVKSNVNYQVAGVIVLQQETQHSLVNALQVIRRWNPDVSPRYALVDFSEEELGALEETFPGIQVYICDYHREEAWKRWMTKAENARNLDADGVKKILRRVANAMTSEDVSQTLAELETSSTFLSHRRLVDWFDNTLKPHLTRWTVAYRAAEVTFLMYTNNGTRSINEDFRYEFMNNCRDVCLSELLAVIIRDYIPSLAGPYMEVNMRSSSLYRKYNDDVPPYLRDRPRRLVDDMRKKMRSLEAGVIAGVRMKSQGVFIVPARGIRPFHDVVFGSESVFCSCTCQSFQRTQLLCVHFCAVFRAFPDWSFDRVSPMYTQSPLLLLDDDLLNAAASASAMTGDVMSPEPKLSSPGVLKQLKSERQRARSLLQEVFEMTYTVSDVTLLQKLVRSLGPIQREMSESMSAGSDVIKSEPTGSTPPSCERKRKLELNKVVLPAEKRQLSTPVIEVHVIDGSDVKVSIPGPASTV